ncbi:hypothetical protein BKH43_02340 [Helicobacter sp. 13S00401-1]|uniref:hypothetical protein n=1 Tax=Helicobacter sp. 13S00401-1 TaxID=1905758 RepID=UPI000BA687B4|nr:hypothetical protein [Helicobacter sp. 13S00401-1]PAF51069.1 hypothetical protein BKH43_02340 [Helicobacter sp. 13S00401-1]
MKKKTKTALKTSVYSMLILGTIGSFGSLQAKTNLMDALQNSTIDGFGFMRWAVVNGKDGNGQRYQLRLKPTVTTGEVDGWSVSAGLFFSIGSSTPDNNYTNDEIQGSRGFRTDMGGSDVFNISNFYVTKNISSWKTLLRAGVMNPLTPMNDVNLDRGIGVYAKNTSVDWANITFLWQDSWMSDDIYIRSFSYQGGNNHKYVGGGANAGILSGTFNNSIGAGIGNDLVSIGLSKETGDFKYRLWYTYGEKLFNYMIFADTSYTYRLNDTNSFTILGQIAATGMQNDFHYLSKSKFLQESGAINSPYSAKDIAKHRGVYNINATYKYAPPESKFSFDVNVGGAGTFGDGYGALIDNTGGLKLGGQIWNTFDGAERNGFGITGAGALKGSYLNLGYATINGQYGKLNLGFNVTFIDTNNYVVLSKASRSGSMSGAAGDMHRTLTAKGVASGSAINPTVTSGFKVHYFEIGPTYRYNFTKNLALIGYWKFAVGDLSFNILRWQVMYTF